MPIFVICVNVCVPALLLAFSPILFTWITNEKCDTKHASEWHQRLNINTRERQFMSEWLSERREEEKRTGRQDSAKNTTSIRFVFQFEYNSMLASVLFAVLLVISLKYLSSLNNTWVFMCLLTFYSRLAHYLFPQTVIYLHTRCVCVCVCVNVILLHIIEALEIFMGTSKLGNSLCVPFIAVIFFPLDAVFGNDVKVLHC